MNMNILNYDLNNLPVYITWRNMINMANGVIGISILTMPFCFYQCGIILGILTLGVSLLMTSYTCHLLMKSAELKKTTNLENLALRTYGPIGKVLFEICMILLLFGSLVTYQQTLNYSIPSMVANLLNTEHANFSGLGFLCFIGIFITLPLSISKSINSFNQISTFSICFYITFSIYLFGISMVHVANKGFSINDIKYWNTAGLFKAFPIFCVAFSIQQVMFHLYEELPSDSKKGMPELLNLSLLLGFFIYSTVGIFGYIAYNELEISGSFIKMLSNNFFNNLLLLGLNICILSGLPYMIFPCRQSLNSLIFQSWNSHDSVEYISENRFIIITISIVFSFVLIAALVPNIAFVLSLTGATTGIMCCYIWPCLLYLRADSNSKKEHTHIKIFLAIGIIMFFVCTFATLEEYNPTKKDLDLSEIKLSDLTTTTEISKLKMIDVTNQIQSAEPKKIIDTLVKNLESKSKKEIINDLAVEIRVEPPNPDNPDNELIKPDLAEEKVRVEPPNPDNPDNELDLKKESLVQQKDVNIDRKKRSKEQSLITLKNVTSLEQLTTERKQIESNLKK